MKKLGVVEWRHEKVEVLIFRCQSDNHGWNFGVANIGVCDGVQYRFEK